MIERDDADDEILHACIGVRCFEAFEEKANVAVVNSLRETKHESVKLLYTAKEVCGNAGSLLIGLRLRILYAGSIHRSLLGSLLACSCSLSASESRRGFSLH